MTTDGYGQEADWDAARVALGRVADVFREQETVAGEDLRSVEGYGLIPEGVRETLESLTPEEQEVAKRVIGTLAANHFYIENGEGGLRFY
jgi:hypothetical protein